MKHKFVCCPNCLPNGKTPCQQPPQGSDNKSVICAYLKEHHTGKGRAIHSQDLQRLFFIDGRNLRRKISALRQAGYPICSDESGYYYADTQQELQNTLRRFGNRVTNTGTDLPVTIVTITIRVEGGIGNEHF